MKNGQSKRLESLQEHKTKLEKEQIIKELPMFEKLSRSELDKRIEIWGEYYKRAAQGGAAKLYHATRSALTKGVLLTVTENGERAKKALAAKWEEPLNRPQFRDPQEVFNSGLVMSYRIVCKAIDEVEGRVEKAPF